MSSEVEYLYGMVLS